MDRRALSVAAVIVVSIALVTGFALAVGGDDEREPEPRSSPSTSDPSSPTLLPPNVRSVEADNLSVQVVGDERRLRFAGTLANLGPGPLLLHPGGRGECAAGEHSAVQVLHEDGNGDGRFQQSVDPEAERRATGCMLRHPDHDHWHFDAMAAYSLRRAGSDEVLVSRDKVSFCLRDNERLPDQPVVVRREYFGDCSRKSRQGISPGWVDIYTADLSGQWLRLPPNLGSQVVCLDLEADPHGLLTETDEADNATSVAIRITGTTVRKVDSQACRVDVR